MAILRAFSVTRRRAKHTHHHAIVQNSRLLDLPRELRDHILSYLLLESADAVLVYFPECRRRYGYAVKASFQDSLGRTRWGLARAPGLEISGTTEKYLHLLSLVQSCRQISYEAQEMFFCRNRFLFFRPSWIAALPKMHSQWITRLYVWCRPSLGESGVIWVFVVIEKTKERPGWRLTWMLSPFSTYETRDDLEALKKKLTPWIRTCEKSTLKKLQGRKRRMMNLIFSKSQGRKETLNLNAVVKVLSGPPMCKKSDISIYATSKPCRHQNDSNAPKHIA